jgi:hypothetical protein
MYNFRFRLRPELPAPVARIFERDGLGLVSVNEPSAVSYQLSGKHGFHDG